MKIFGILRRTPLDNKVIVPSLIDFRFPILFTPFKPASISKPFEVITYGKDLTTGTYKPDHNVKDYEHLPDNYLEMMEKGGWHRSNYWEPLSRFRLFFHHYRVLDHGYLIDKTFISPYPSKRSAEIKFEAFKVIPFPDEVSKDSDVPKH